jgi:hypothetical protein
VISLGCRAWAAGVRPPLGTSPDDGGGFVHDAAFSAGSLTARGGEDRSRIDPEERSRYIGESKRAQKENRS